MITIRKLEPQDVADFAPLGTRFHEETDGGFTRQFDPYFFEDVVTTLMEQDTLHAFGLWADDEPAGIIGGVLSPDICNGDMVMYEAFWFVAPELRGDGLKLLKAFLDFAETVSTRQVLAHLIASMPERLENLYRRMGFEKAEVHYTRDSA